MVGKEEVENKGMTKTDTDHRSPRPLNRGMGKLFSVCLCTCLT